MQGVAILGGAKSKLGVMQGLMRSLGDAQACVCMLVVLPRNCILEAFLEGSEVVRGRKHMQVPTELGAHCKLSRDEGL